MADAFHIGFDQPDVSGVLSVPDHPFAPAAAEAPQQANPTDPDWSNFPEARTTSKGPDGLPPSQPSALSNFWSSHTGPQEAPKPDGADVVGSMANVSGEPPAGGEPTAPPPPPGSTAPDAAGLSQPFTPAPEKPLTGYETLAEMVGDRKKAAAQNSADFHALTSGIYQAWENDNLLGGLQNAQGDAIANIIAGVKEKLGVTLQDPTMRGYHDEAVQRVLQQAQYQSSGSYFDSRNPEGFFGGGALYKQAVEKAQMDIFDEKRQALVQKIQGDQAFDRAGENADALKLLDADTPGAMLGAQLSHQANVAAGQAIDAAGNSVTSRIAQFIGNQIGGVRDPINDLLLMASGGEATLAKNYFPMRSQLAMAGANTLEAGARQAAINLGLTAITSPEHQAANEARGEEYGLVPALHDFVDAGLSGFVPGVLIHGIKALRELHGSGDSQAWIDEFLRQAKGEAPDGPTTELGKKFMDDVHAWERENGHPEGWTYSDIVQRRAATGEAATAKPRSESSSEPPYEGPPQLPGPQKLLEGPRPFPKSPDLPPESRNRPSPSSITGDDVRSAEADAAAMPPMLPGVPPSEHLRAYTEAVRHGEAPDVMAPPEPPMHAPPAADVNFLPPDHLPEEAKQNALNPVARATPDQVFEHSGKPVTAGLTFPARDLRTDAATYQYKAGGDANGVTDRLQSVRKWNPLSVGNIVVHERADGTRYVVDGHQRTGLAKRIMEADGGQDISLPGFLFKEKDGWTPEDVRAEAAAKNIREGLGDTLDIARILRDKPEMWDDSLPIGRGDMKEARGLANLSDDAWGMAINGKPRRDFASFVGNMAEDKTTHSAIMQDLINYDPKTQNEARMIIADAMQAGFNKSEQNDLFGTHEVTESLRGERSKVYAAAERLLSSDKKIFGMLDAEASRIIEAGNVLADTNAERADRAGQLAQGLIKLAQRAGPVSSALNRAAKRVADGEAPKTAARTFLNELPALLKDEGVAIADVKAPVKYSVDNPKDREEQIHDLEAEFMATQPTMFGEPEPAPRTTLPPEEIIADLAKALETGHVDAKRFSSAPTTAQLDDIIQKAREHEDAEVDRLFGDDAKQVKKWLRSNSDKAVEKLQDLVDDKYGSGSPQEHLIFGNGDGAIANIESLKALRDTISNIEGSIGDKEMLPRELAWLAPKLPDFAKEEGSHTEAERIALLGLARALEDMQAHGVDAEKVMRQAVDYSGHRTGGDADDAHTLMEKIVPYTKQFMQETTNVIPLAPSTTVGAATTPDFAIRPEDLTGGAPAAPVANANAAAPDESMQERVDFYHSLFGGQDLTMIENLAKRATLDGQIGEYLHKIETDPNGNQSADLRVAAAVAWRDRKPPILEMTPEKQETTLRQMAEFEKLLRPGGKFAGEPPRNGTKKKWLAGREQARDGYDALRPLVGLHAVDGPGSGMGIYADMDYSKEPVHSGWGWHYFSQPKEEWHGMHGKEVVVPDSGDVRTMMNVLEGKDPALETVYARSRKRAEEWALDDAEDDRQHSPVSNIQRTPADVIPFAKRAVDEALAAARASPDPLDKQIGDVLSEEIKPLLDAVEAGPEGSQQTLMPGVNPVRDADRARLGAAAPLRGGNREMPAGGLFDEMAQAQKDFFDMTPTDSGLKTREQILNEAPPETVAADIITNCPM